MKIPVDPVRLAPALALLLKGWSRSLRYDVDTARLDLLQQMQRDGQPCLLALWHNELIALTALGLRVGLPMTTVVSQSKDGEIIAQVLERIGHATVRGSSSKGGVRALIGLKRVMHREKRVGVLTIDGPRGPRHEPKNGVIFLAHRAGAKIMPVRAFPRSKYVFKRSWDRFELPAPFTKCRVEMGQPYTLNSNTLDEDDLGAERERLKRKMSELGEGYE